MDLLQKQPNPLTMFMRQPKIYIKLPSKGEYWPSGSLEVTENNEYPVYSMTAKDELLLQVPDALMNGQAVVDVIESCLPNIKNAWECPNIDIDLILIAIRIATYGEKLNSPITVAGDVEFEYQVDLRSVLDELMNKIHWDPLIPINENLTVFVRPLAYKQVTSTSIATFETQKIIDIANNAQLTEDEKLKLFKESLDKLTEVTLGSIKYSILKIDSINGSTSDPEHISEFVSNTDKEIFNKIQNHLENLKELNSLKPIVVPVDNEMRAKGITSDTIEVPLQFDPATFFA
jgi:hypothetical protein